MLTPFDYNDFVSRNSGLVEHQDTLKRTTVAIAGCGAEGGSTAITLARMGVGSLRLSDPDVFDLSNVNRQWGSSSETVGRNKAEVVAEQVRRINPTCEVWVDTTGVSETSVDAILDGADIAIEGIDYWHAKAMVTLYRYCRKTSIPAITGASVGWRSIAVLFEPDGLSFEEYVGASPLSPIDWFTDFVLPPTTFLPEPLPYVSDDLLQAILAQEAAIPVIAPSVNLTAALLSALTTFRLNGQREVASAPAYYSTDDLLLMHSKGEEA